MSRRILCLLALLSCWLTQTFPAQAKSAGKKIPILKINQYYIPFLAPRGPYLDSGDHIVVPVTSFCHAAGIELSERGKEIRLSLGENHLTIPEGTGFIPLATLIASFGLNSHWEGAEKRLVITDERLMKKPSLVANPNTSGLGDYSRLADTAERIAVLSVVRRMEREAATGRSRYEMRIAVKNLSDADLPKGKFFPILMSVSKESVGFAGATPPGTPDNPYRPYPPLKSGGTFVFTCGDFIDPKSPIEYMIFFVGIRHEWARKTP